MSNNKSQWSKYDNEILRVLDKNSKKGKIGNTKVAKLILGENASYKDVDLFRTYVRRFKIKNNILAPHQTEPKILMFDIETAPMKAYTWGKWNQNINDDFIIQDWFILCWSAKWLFDDTVYNASLTKKEVKNGDDERIVRSLWAMMDEADVICAHNLIKFDNKKAKTRFMKHDMDLPRPYQMIDTLLHLRKAGAITSNRLDYIAKSFLGIEGKMDTPKGLWLDVMDGKEGAMETMQAYCDVDIRVLEDVYLRFRKYFQPHTNLSLFMENVNAPKCPTCGSTHLEEYGEYATTVNVYQSYKCGDCGSLSRARKAKLPKEHTQNILSSLPK